MKRRYEIFIPVGLKINRREKYAAEVLKEYFKTDVVVLRPINAYKKRTPDFRIGDLECELKTPVSHKVERVKHLVWHASTQARIVIVDSRKTKILDKRMEELCREALAKTKRIDRVILITKNRNKVIDIRR